MRPVVPLLLLALVSAPLSAATLEMPAPPAIVIEEGTPVPLRAVLLVSDELRQTAHTVRVDAFGKLAFPTGRWTVALFAMNLCGLFDSVLVVEEGAPMPAFDALIRLEIVRFDARLPDPAEDAIGVTVEYRVEIADPGGARLLSLSAVGEGRAARGAGPAAQARAQAAEAASVAMVEAARKILVGLLAAEELRPGAPSPGD